ncbi:hypothetical protein [Sphingomonas asaccharolytica]|uniref:hypothetical protein n=1 Tax=Sphingomonas asaccharolytica TaxID=40681 RepID=UPI000AE935FC|nr:hypothetical protein [Sphingomonas asaccharolytica]
MKLHGRSGLEDKTMEDLAVRGVPYRYEEVRVSYEKPASRHKYTPDFILPNGIIVETKGIFEVADRQKHELVKAQHPGLDIRFVFSRSKSPIRKGSKTTYASWCAGRGIPFSDKVIPQAWIDEADNPERHAAIAAASA